MLEKYIFYNVKKNVAQAIFFFARQIGGIFRQFVVGGSCQNILAIRKGVDKYIIIVYNSIRKRGKEYESY